MASEVSEILKEVQDELWGNVWEKFVVGSPQPCVDQPLTSTASLVHDRPRPLPQLHPAAHAHGSLSACQSRCLRRGSDRTQSKARN